MLKFFAIAVVILGTDINGMAHGAWRMAHGKDSEKHAFWR
jgi:hypothetical protein